MATQSALISMVSTKIISFFEQYPRQNIAALLEQEEVDFVELCLYRLREDHEHGATQSRLAAKNAQHILSSRRTDGFNHYDTEMSREDLNNKARLMDQELRMMNEKCKELHRNIRGKTITKKQCQGLVALQLSLIYKYNETISLKEALASATSAYLHASLWRDGMEGPLYLLLGNLSRRKVDATAFGYVAYSIVTQLMQSVPSFVKTWVECLGDLARFMMAIGEAEYFDHKIWSNVARLWYNKAADKSPGVGRIQHHLAVLAKPNIVQRLFYHSKSLISIVPFVTTRATFMVFFEPFLRQSKAIYTKYPVVEASLVAAWVLAFTRGNITEYTTHVDKFIRGLDNHIRRTSSNFQVQGVEVASCLIAGMLDFGVDENHLWIAVRTDSDNLKVGAEALQGCDSNLDAVKAKETIGRTKQQNTGETICRNAGNYNKIQNPPEMAPERFSSSDEVTSCTTRVFLRATSIVAQRIGDKNTMPYMHVVLAFLYSLSFVPGALPYLELHIPWAEIKVFLNTLARSGVNEHNTESEGFPTSDGETGRQLPEDFLLRGLIWSRRYYPHDFFTTSVVCEEDRTLELPSHAAPRAERCLWLGVQLSRTNRYVQYDYQSKLFSTTAYVESLAS